MIYLICEKKILKNKENPNIFEYLSLSFEIGYQTFWVLSIYSKLFFHSNFQFLTNLRGEVIRGSIK